MYPCSVGWLHWHWKKSYDSHSASEVIFKHYGDVIMGAMASLITSLTIVYSIVYSMHRSKKHQSSASLAFVWGIHRWPVNSPHKWPVTRKKFPFDEVIMSTWLTPHMPTPHPNPSAACMRQWTESALVKVKACRLFGAKPLSEPMLPYCHLTHGNKFQWNSERNPTIFI